MKAVQISALNQLMFGDVANPVPAAGEVVVGLKTAALNHRDVWIKQGQYAGIVYPCIPGSDGAGIVEATGVEVTGSSVGGEVILNPSLNWGNSEATQGANFSILGLPRAGTLAEKVVVPASQVTPKPAHLNWDEAAALPLAGLTAYRALFARARLQPGERLLVTGIGGGVALSALQFAVALGAEVWVTSSRPDKIERAVRMGAKGGFDYGQVGWAKAAGKQTGLFDVILDSAGGEGFESLLDLAAPGGRVVFFGATVGNPPVLPMRKIFWRQLSLLGTTMGSPTDWQAMIAFVERHQIRPVVSETFALSAAAEAFALMERGGQCGKIVVRM